MARFLLYSIHGDGLSIARRLQKQGHDVRFYLRPPATQQGRGLVPLTTDPKPDREVVIFDGTGAARVGQLYRKAGWQTIGGYPVEEWETRRMKGINIMQEYGLEVPETHEFKTLQEARQFLKKNDGFWYFKPDGDNVPKHVTRGFEAPFLLRWLDYVERHLPTDVRSFILQKKVEGTEIDVCAWLNRSGVVAAEATIEEKKAGTGDTGPATGCQSNLVWTIDPASRLFEHTMEPFIEPLMDSGYIGIASINVIISNLLGVYGLEFTLRPGFDSTQASMLLFGDSFGDQLEAFAHNGLYGFQRHGDEYAMTLRESTIPQPVDPEKTKEYEGIPIDESILDDPNFFPDDLKQGPPKGLVIAGGSGYVGVFGTTGTDLPLMRQNLVDRCRRYVVPDGQYRIDPVSRAEATLDFLHTHGLVKPLLLSRDSPPKAARVG